MQWHGVCPFCPSADEQINVKYDQKYKKMKRIFILTILLLSGVLVYSQNNNKVQMPVTTVSKPALVLYKEAMRNFADVKLDKALETFKKALVQDPDFFMVNYQLSFFYLMNRSADNFEKFADAALACKTKLSDAEEILKKVLVSLKNGESNVVDAGKKLVEMFPGDPEAYNNLVYYQSLANDSVGIVETLKKAITVAPKPAPFYNQLGYAYLTLKQEDKAEAAFDKYIELDPKNPNVYDSKGDFYMFLKKYDKAYESYIMANSMDASFSKEKTAAAKELYERTEGKKLDIISM
jgi:tetratricopeptide (TPR) repeat protein